MVFNCVAERCCVVHFWLWTRGRADQNRCRCCYRRRLRCHCHHCCLSLDCLLTIAHQMSLHVAPTLPMNTQIPLFFFLSSLNTTAFWLKVSWDHFNRFEVILCVVLLLLVFFFIREFDKVIAFYQSFVELSFFFFFFEGNTLNCNFKKAKIHIIFSHF